MRDLLTDLRAVLRAWRRSPGLPLASVLVVALTLPLTLPGAPTWSLVLLVPLGLLQAAALGAERIWYVAVWRRRPVDRLDWQRWARACVLPFTLLGAVAALAVAVPVVALTASRPGDPAALLTALLAAAVAVDGMLTFVPVVLALRTRHVGAALAEGLALLGSTWPRNLLYVVLPPAGLLLVARTDPEGFLPRTVAVAAALVLALLACLHRGLTTAYALRHLPAVRTDGVAAGRTG